MAEVLPTNHNKKTEAATQHPPNPRHSETVAAAALSMRAFHRQNVKLPSSGYCFLQMTGLSTLSPITFDCAKRLIDLLFCVCVLFGFSWLILLAWVLVKLESPGPALFVQQRVGRFGKTFNCFKLRTMRVGTPNVATHDVPTESITSIGRILRSTKIDELPQVLNILRNEMSLVGPRPCLPTQSDVISARNNAGVFAIKPGITGLAQVNHVDMMDPELLAAWDARYTNARAISLDLRIIIQTAVGRGTGDPARRDPIANQN